MKKILIINGHPYKDSIASALQKAYVEGAESVGHTVYQLYLRELNFRYDLPQGYRQLPEPEEHIKRVWEMINEADHLVFIYPNWWATYPAMLKGFIDRVFIPGFAFKYVNGGRRKKLLTGKSARIIVTMDDPAWYYQLILGSPGSKALKKAVLRFCGVSPVRITTLGQIRKLRNNQLDNVLKRCRLLGMKAI